jgi:hypothetical protein
VTPHETAAAVRLGGAFVRRGTGVVTAVTLPPASGLVLPDAPGMASHRRR